MLFLCSDCRWTLYRDNRAGSACLTGASVIECWHNAFSRDFAGAIVPHLSAARFLSHFYAPLGLLLGGLVAAQQSSLNEFFTSLFNVLPTVLLLLGGAFCIAYGRMREASLLLLI